MKTKKLLVWLLAFVAVFSSMMFVACSSDQPSDSSSSSAEEEITVTLPETATVAEFESIPLVATVKGEGTLVWSSSDESVLTVSQDGTVYGVKAGTANVTAAIGDAKGVCAVTVTPTHFAHELVLSAERISMSKGKSSGVNVSVKFNGEPLSIDVDYVWTPVNGADEIVSVVKNGNTATFTGIAVGEAVYEVSATVRGYEVFKRINVTVIDNVVFLDMENSDFSVDENGYKTALTLGDETTDRKQIGNVNVIFDGESRGAASVNWTSENDDIAVVENGVIMARKAGTVNLNGTAEYEGRTLSVRVSVKVGKGERTLENVKTTVEVAVDGGMRIPSEISGTVEKIVLSGKEVFNGTTDLSDGYATFIANSLPAEMKDLGEYKSLVIETDVIVYNLKADVYTLIIDDKAEFDSWQEIAEAEAVRAGICPTDAIGQYMSGYFVLGNDIAYNQTYALRRDYLFYWGLGNNGVNGVKYGSGEWGDGSSYGFRGVFDGKGHTVEGLKMSGQFNALVITLAGGTIKNLSFTETQLSGDCSLLARAGKGVIENIYVNYARITNDSSNNVSTAFGSGNAADRQFKNSVVDISACAFDDSTANVWLLGGAYGTLENLFVIGKNNVNLLDKADVGTLVARFDDYSALFANEEAFAAVNALDKTMWTVNERIVLPASVAKNHADDVPVITNSETEVNKNASLEIKSTTKYVAYSLKEEHDGVTLNVNVLNVDRDVEEGTRITIVVTSLVSGKSSEITLDVTKIKHNFTLNERKRIELDLTVENSVLKAGEAVALDLSEAIEHINGIRTVVKLGDTVLFDGNGAESVIINAASVATVFGEKTLIVTAYGDIEDYEFTLPVLFVSKSIKTKADLDSWQEVACRIAVDSGLIVPDAYRQFMTGYFELSNDIDYNAIYSPYVKFNHYWSLGNDGVNGVKYGSENWGDGTSFGFKGIFNGNGHAIKGMSVTGNLDAFIVVLAGGTVKNVAFADARISGNASLVVKAGIGRLENIFVQYDSIKDVDGGGTFFTTGNDSDRYIKNCIIDVNSCNFSGNSNVMLIGADAASHADTNPVYDGVYVVGNIDSGISLKDQKAACGCAYGAFADYAALLGDEGAAAKIEEFDRAFWTVTDKLVAASGVVLENDVTPEITVEVTRIEPDTTLKLTANCKFITFALETAIDGVTVSGNVLTVGAGVPVGTQITITAISLVNGGTAQLVLTVKEVEIVYELGSEIDMDSMTFDELKGFGRSNFWNRGINDGASAPEGASGKVIEGNNDGTDMAGHAYGIRFNGLTVKDGMEFIKIRTYVASADATCTLYFYRSDRANHEVQPDVWFDYTTNVATNEWVDVLLPVPTFEVDGKIYGYNCCVISSCTALYVDCISVNSYELGSEIDMDSMTFAGLEGFGPSNIWNRGINDGASAPEGASGKVIEGNNDGNDMTGHAYGIRFNGLTVKAGMEYIKIRTYVTSAEATCNLRFYRSDRTNQEVQPGVWFDYTTNVATNEWVDVVLPVSTFAVDGKIYGYTCGVFSSCTALYVDCISIVDMVGERIALTGGTISYPGQGNAWGCTTDTPTVISGEQFEISGGSAYGNAFITFAQPVTVTSESKIVIRFRLSSAEIDGNIIFFNSQKEHKETYSGNLPVDNYVNFELNMANFAVDGTLTGFSIGLWGSCSGITLYVAGISVY